MPLNNFNVGSDTRVVIQHPLAPGGTLTISDLVSFKADQDTKALNYTRIDGKTRKAEYPTGWNGTIDTERASQDLDDFMASVELAILSGVNVTGGTIYQYVNEVDGSTSTYQFQGVSFKLTDAGSYMGAETVKQTLAFVAETRKSI